MGYAPLNDPLDFACDWRQVKNTLILGARCEKNITRVYKELTIEWEHQDMKTILEHSSL